MLVPRSTMPASRPETSSNAPFPTTRWSQVVAAGDRAGPAAREALAERCSACWHPLHGEILRDEIARTVADPADVEDEVRALFAALAR
jgi:hypothetical protein